MFVFSIAVTLKIRSRSLKSNQSVLCYVSILFSWKLGKNYIVQTRKLHLLFSFSTAMTLKIRSWSPKAYHFFMSQLYIQANLVRIQPQVHKMLCRQESVEPKPKPTLMGSTPKSICTPPHRWGDITTQFATYSATYRHINKQQNSLV